jgi:hypothetical protein
LQFLDRQQQDQPMLEKTEADALLRLLVSKARELKQVFQHTEYHDGTASSVPATLKRPAGKAFSASAANSLNMNNMDDNKSRYSPGVVSLLFADLGELSRDIVSCVSELIDPSRILKAITELEKLLPAALDAAAIKSRKTVVGSFAGLAGTFSDASATLLELGANLNLRLAALTSATQAAVGEFLDLKKKVRIAMICHCGSFCEALSRRINFFFLFLSSS